MEPTPRREQVRPPKDSGRDALAGVNTNTRNRDYAHSAQLLGTTWGPRAVHPAGQPTCRRTIRSSTVAKLTSGNAYSHVLRVKGFGDASVQQLSSATLAAWPGLQGQASLTDLRERPT
jgi:hypothetical protein